MIILSDFTRKEGTNTSNENKADMAALMRTALEEDNIRISHPFITTSPSPQAFLADLKTQLKAFERVVVPTKSLRTKNSIIFSGKGPNKLQRDDLSLTVIRALLRKSLFFSDPRYARYRS